MNSTTRAVRSPVRAIGAGKRPFRVRPAPRQMNSATAPAEHSPGHRDHAGSGRQHEPCPHHPGSFYPALSRHRSPRANRRSPRTPRGGATDLSARSPSWPAFRRSTLRRYASPGVNPEQAAALTSARTVSRPRRLRPPLTVCKIAASALDTALCALTMANHQTDAIFLGKARPDAIRRSPSDQPISGITD